ncbi:MAG: helix-turn-helix domain-containing protein [Candidatus Marsarchaeota archaeon]|nr:helix-turn-helix domain-containing protein [Candidatus Marsarchaeota archaeon]
MGKHGDTKSDILRLIAGGDETLSSICNKLNLAPSTVSKHLKDLKESGAIYTKENDHIKKWKFYSLDKRHVKEPYTPAVQRNHAISANPASKRTMITAVTVVFAIIAIYLYYISTSQVAGSGVDVAALSNTTHIPISITDPPQVPSGTQSLYINYSSLRVLVSYENTSEWISVNSSGRLNLMGLVNKSQMIGIVNMKPNSTINKIKFNVSSANITISNSTYGVYLPQKTITTTISNLTEVNGSSNLLIDFSPTIATIITQNSTMFVLVPSLKAMIIPHLGLTSKFGPNNSGQAPLPLPKFAEDAIYNMNANVSTAANLHIDGNNIEFNAILDNLGNGNITIFGLGIEDGNYLPIGGFTMRMNNGYGGIYEHHYLISINMANSSQANQIRFYRQINSSVMIDAQEMYASADQNNESITIDLQNPVNTIRIYNISLIQKEGPNPPFLGPSPLGIHFVVNQNGTLSILSKSAMQAFIAGNIGYTLKPRSSISLGYNGSMEYDNQSLFKTNHTYGVTILTNEGLLQTNITT